MDVTQAWCQLKQAITGRKQHMSTQGQLCKERTRRHGWTQDGLHQHAEHKLNFNFNFNYVFTSIILEIPPFLQVFFIGLQWSSNTFQPLTGSGIMLQTSIPRIRTVLATGLLNNSQIWSPIQGSWPCLAILGEETAQTPHPPLLPPPSLQPWI